MFERGNSLAGGPNSASFRRSPTKVLLVGAGILIILLCAVAGYFFWQYISVKNNPSAVAEETTARIVKKVGEIYSLPGGTPTIAQVQDKEKVKDQEFFKGAENGDYILLYTDAKLALLYRESIHKLIYVGPIATKEGEPTQSGQ